MPNTCQYPIHCCAHHNFLLKINFGDECKILEWSACSRKLLHVVTLIGGRGGVTRKNVEETTKNVSHCCSSEKSFVAVSNPTQNSRNLLFFVVLLAHRCLLFQILSEEQKFLTFFSILVTNFCSSKLLLRFSQNEKKKIISCVVSIWLPVRIHIEARLKAKFWVGDEKWREGGNSVDKLAGIWI